MENIKKEILLVPYDFSPVADIAINHATSMAKVLGMPVCLFHVFEKDLKLGEKEAVNNKINDIVNGLKEKHIGIDISFLTKDGNIFTDIANAAELMNARFVIMGTHGIKGMQHITGSYAMKVITKSDVPFIVVQNATNRSGYNNIVITIDETIETKQKIKWAVYIAQLFNSTIHIFYPNDNDEFIGGAIKRNVRQIKAIFEKNNINFVDVEADKKSGNFAKKTIEYAQSVEADLMVIITNPDQFLPSFVMTKSDEQILFNNAGIPVMCINPRDLHIPIYGM